MPLLLFLTLSALKAHSFFLLSKGARKAQVPSTSSNLQWLARHHDNNQIDFIDFFTFVTKERVDYKKSAVSALIPHWMSVERAAWYLGRALQMHNVLGSVRHFLSWWDPKYTFFNFPKHIPICSTGILDAFCDTTACMCQYAVCFCLRPKMTCDL